MDDTILNSILEELGISVNFENSFTQGKWPEENSDAKEWKIVKDGVMYGLYDASGRESTWNWLWKDLSRNASAGTTRRIKFQGIDNFRERFYLCDRMQDIRPS